MKVTEKFQSGYRKIPVRLPKNSSQVTEKFRSGYRKIPVRLPKNSGQVTEKFRSEGLSVENYVENSRQNVKNFQKLKEAEKKEPPKIKVGDKKVTEKFQSAPKSYRKIPVRKDYVMAEKILDVNPKNKSTLLVQKSKPLFDFWENDFNLFEFQMLDLYISRIDIHNPENREVRINKKDLERILGVTKINKSVIVSKLSNLLSPVRIEDPENPEITILTHLFSRAEIYYDGQNSVITLAASQDASKYFFDIDNIGYIKYRLENVLKLKNLYSYKLYTYIEKNRFRKQWTITFDKLKKYIFSGKVPNLYAEYKFFNVKILKPAKMDIETNTASRFEYRKKGDELIFTVKPLKAIETTAQDVESNADISGPFQNAEEDWEPMYTDLDYMDYIYSLREISGDMFTLSEVELIVNALSSELKIETIDLQMNKFKNLVLMLRTAEEKGLINNKLKYILKIIANEKSEALPIFENLFQ